MAKKLSDLTKLSRHGVEVGLHYQDSDIQSRRLAATLTEANKELKVMQDKLKDKPKYLADIRESIKRELAQ